MERDLVEQVKEILQNDESKHSKRNRSLKDFYSKLAKLGIDTKTSYSLPPLDTIGRNFREQFQSKVSND